MADIVSDGMTKVSWVTTISNTSAPTTTELNAGVALESFITPDGLNIDWSIDAVDTTALSSTFGAELPGRSSASIEVTMKDQGRDSAPWSTFASSPDGYLVVRRNLAASTAWTSSQTIEVYPGQAGVRRPIAPAANELSRFSVGIMPTSAPVMGSVIA